jgi:cathepsin L
VEIAKKCNMNITRLPINITSIREEYPNGDENALLNMLKNNGPVIIANYATSNFISYSGGVFFDPSCTTQAVDCDAVNHALLLVGYGTDPVYGDYWKVKNSWVSVIKAVK